METIKSFLASKGVTSDQLAAWPDDQCRAVAQAMGLAMPKPSKLLLLAHTNAKGKTGVFVVDATGYPEVWEKVNEGDTVTAEGLAAYTARQAARLAIATVGTKGAVRAKK
jgi:hypothetical protein